MSSPKRESEQEKRNRLRSELAAEPENSERWLALGNDLALRHIHHCMHREQGHDFRETTPDFQEAIECFLQATKLAPDDPLPWNSLGHAYRANLKPKQALESYLESVKRDPSAWMPRLILAELYRQEASLQEAEYHIDSALKSHPENHQVLYAKAHMLHSTGKHAEAIPLYKKVLEKQPRIRQALAGLGLAYAHLGQFEVGEALIWEAIEICDDCYDVNYALAEFYDLAGRPEEAKQMRVHATKLFKQYLPKSRAE